MMYYYYSKIHSTFLLKVYLCCKYSWLINIIIFVVFNTNHHTILCIITIGLVLNFMYKMNSSYSEITLNKHALMFMATTPVTFSSKCRFYVSEMILTTTGFSMS